MLGPWFGNFSFPHATGMGGTIEALIPSTSEGDCFWSQGL